MDLDPRLRDSRPSETYASIQVPPYKANTIHLPQPHSAGLSEVASSTVGHPYYSIPQSSPQKLYPHPPNSEQDLEPEYTNSARPAKHADQQHGDIKRPRACEACRGLKVRCEPDPVTKTCKRCAKAGRQCVITEPSRKRQKKADTKVAELERKVDELTSRLNGAKHPSGSEDDSNEEDGPMELSVVHEDSHSLDRAHSSRKRRKQSSPEGRYGTRDVNRRPMNHPMLSDLNGTQDDCSTRRSLPASSGIDNPKLSKIPSLDLSLPSHEYADVVDRKILDAAMAAEIFYHYVNNMAKHMPVVTFPPEITAGEIRQTKPTLFLAILSVASSQDYPDIQKTLLREVKRVYADSIIYRGEKSLELIQALQVSSIWCGPDLKDNTRPYQIINTAAVMAMTIGLGRRKKIEKSHGFGIWKNAQQSKNSAIDPTSRESRRALLGCYTLSSNFAQLLRQPNLFRWNEYMDECVDVLQNSPDAIFHDRILCQWAKLQQLGDEFVENFDQDDVNCTLTPNAQLVLKGFKDRAQTLRSQTPEDLRSATPLALGFQAIDLCILKTGVRHETNVEELNAFGESQDLKSETVVVSPSGIEARRKLLKSIHALLDEFLSFSVEDVRSFPSFHFVCVAYAASCLLLLYTRAVESDSELTKSIPPASLNVDLYLTHLLDLLHKAASNGKSRLAQNFQLIVLTLKSWYERRKSGRKPNVDLKLQAKPVDTGRDTPSSGYRKISVQIDKSGGAAASKNSLKAKLESKHDTTFPPNPSQPSTPMRNIENSPLHLLSQVATSNPPVVPQHHQLNAAPPTAHEAWYPPYPPPLIQNNAPQIPYSDNSQPYYPLQDGYSDPPDTYGGTYPNLSIDPGLEQAIGMTFGGEGDFCEMLIGEGYLGVQGLQGAQPGFGEGYDGVWNSG